MRTNLVIATLLAATVGVAACNDTTAPKRPRLAHIANIKVTDHATSADTVKISFNYYLVSCDTGVVVEARPTAEGMRFTVTSWPTNLACPLTATSTILGPPPVGFVVNPWHQSPLKLVFTQPGGTDSVRVVGA